MESHRRNIVINDEIWKGIQVFILNKQGYYKKGDISKWINIAVNNLITGYNAQAHSTQNINPYNIPKGRLKAKNLMQDICNQLIQSGLRIEVNPQSTIPLKHLDQMIRDVTGHHDERTIKTHINNLVKYGYIKSSGLAFLILDTGTNEEYFERLMEQQKEEERRNQHNEAMKQKQQELTIPEVTG